MPALPDRILLRLADGLRRPLDPEEVYFLEAIEGATRLRSRSARALIDIRPLGDLAPLFAPHGFLRAHRNHMVNLRRVRDIRRRPSGEDWELKLEPPVNRVLPISRSHLEEVWKAFGED